MRRILKVIKECWLEVVVSSVGMLASLILLMYSLTGIALICKGYQADLFDKICLLLLSLLLLWNSAAFQENRTRNYWWKEFKKEIEKLKAEHINQ